MGADEMRADCLEYVEDRAAALKRMVRIYWHLRFIGREAGEPEYLTIVDLLQVFRESIGMDDFAALLAIAVWHLANKEEL
jgi:hypothetical protein